MARDTRTPIERMIDEACGVPKDAPVPNIFNGAPTIVLHCPSCHRRKIVERDAEDGDAKVLDLTCPQCVPALQPPREEEKR